MIDSNYLVYQLINSLERDKNNALFTNEFCARFSWKDSLNMIME